MIIEDNVDIAYIFNTTLMQAGFKTKVFLEGEQALARLEVGYRPDLLVIDLHIPGCDGERILNKVGTQLRAAGTKIMLITADGQGMQLQPMVDMVLMKPIRSDQLAQFAQRLTGFSANHPA